MEKISFITIELPEDEQILKNKKTRAQNSKDKETILHLSDAANNYALKEMMQDD